MKVRNALMIGAAVLAGVTLLLAGYEVATRFGQKADLLQLLFAISSVVTAIVCLTILDWARNLGTGVERRAASRAGGEDDDDASEGHRMPVAEARLLDAVHALDALANDEVGVEKTIAEALHILARCVSAERADLWMTTEQGAADHRAAYINGEATFGQSPAEPPEEGAIAQTIEHCKPFESLEGDLARFLCPLMLGRRCVGVLKVIVAVAGDEDERPNAVQEASAALARLAGPVARAVCAPDLYDQAVIDGLTGVYTRRHFINRLTEATGMSRRYGEPLSVVLLDIDSFGMLNERYGHETADRSLQEVASLIQDNIRGADSAYRYGPDEFAVILPDTDVDRAASLAERLRGAIRAVRPLAEEGGKIIVSVSVGIAEFDEDMRGIGPLIAHAEGALYSAKSTGHDRVVAWSEQLDGAEPAELD